mmetsp:Transcript_29689/g.58870  ORF Transcript_29689/g.58870 Transcript_29689/m.58870 type:complete len:457 (+) Transcript_29689:830-2200(+)
MAVEPRWTAPGPEPKRVVKAGGQNTLPVRRHGDPFDGTAMAFKREKVTGQRSRWPQQECQKWRPHPHGSFRRCGVIRRSLFGFGHLFLIPDGMVLFCPLLIHLTGRHGLQSAFHADAAKIDVRDDDSDKDKSNNAMPQLRQLHFLVGAQNLRQRRAHNQVWQTSHVEDLEGLSKHRHFKWKQQRHTRQGNREAQNDHGPEYNLLTCVKLLRGRVHTFGEQPTGLGHPFDVATIRNIVLDPNDEHKHQADHKGPGDVVMHPFACFSDVSIDAMPHPWDQKFAAGYQVEAGQAKQDEAYAHNPVAEAFKSDKANDIAAGLWPIDQDFTAVEIEAENDNNHAAQKPEAIGQQRPFAERQPSHAGILDQQARSWPARGGGGVSAAISQRAKNFRIRGCAACAKLVNQRLDITLTCCVTPEGVIQLLATLTGHNVFQRLGTTCRSAIGHLLSETRQSQHKT